MARAAFGLLCIILCANSGFANPFLAKADSVYELRGLNFNESTMLADSSTIDEAIRLYQEAITQTDGATREEAVWKLIRCYYYKGYYTTDDNELKKTLYDKGKDVGKEALKTFPDSKGIHLWMAVMWGVWGEAHGILSAARKGVAGKMRDHCEKLMELDDTYDNGAAYRLYGRLHFKAPKIPLILGWPSKKQALKYLEKANEMDPENLFSQQYLAEALYDQGEKERAISILEHILATDHIVEGVAEDACIKKVAQNLLEEWTQ